MMSPQLRITTCQAENTVSLMSGLAGYLQQTLDLSPRVEEQFTWQARYEALDAGQIDIAWICGHPYITRTTGAPPPFELLAAPIMAPARYQQRPIYFSDVVVAAGSPYQTFEDLRGAVLAINDPDSMSGCHALRYRLHALGESGRFFSRVVASGAHRRSLALLSAGEIDTAAIDSTLLDWLLARQPELHSQIRVIDSLGPFPIPPLVIRRALPRSLRAAIRQLLLEMHAEPAGQALLNRAQIARFSQIGDTNYDLIRRLDRQATRVRLRVERPEQPSD